MVGENKSEDGQDIDAIFGMHAVSNRIVLSAFIMGVANGLLSTIGKNSAKIYRGG